MGFSNINNAFRRLPAALSALAVVACAGVASADTQLDIDLNNFRVTADFNADAGLYTLAFSDDIDTEIENIRIDGDDAAGFSDPFEGNTTADFIALAELEGTATSGTVTSAIFQLRDDAGNVFSFDEVGGFYQDTGTAIEVLLILSSPDGEFNSNEFAGVDVTMFNEAAPLDVSVAVFYVNRKLFTNRGHLDSTADADISVVAAMPVPEPATAGLLLGGAGLTLLRRRRA